MKTIIEVYNTLAPKLASLGKIYLAGGCVRDHLMSRQPKDFDLFILGSMKDIVLSPEAFQKFVKIKLDLEPYGSDLDWHKSEPFWLTNLRLDDETEVQIMHRELNTAEELVDTFDWDICRYAYGEEGVIQYRDVSSIKPGETLNLHKVTFPASTLRRGYRFSERFQMKIKPEDLQKLCRAIVKRDKETDYLVWP